jgi:ubiquinone/menaquinone biosynthesis C-methylase UbiE
MVYEEGRPDNRKAPPLRFHAQGHFAAEGEGCGLPRSGAHGLTEGVREALDAAGCLSGKRVLDLGCGRGELACEAASRGAYVVGVDGTDAALELSRERISALDQETRERIELVKAESKEIPYPDYYFDLAFLVHAYGQLHPQEITATLEEIKRVLRPDGRLIIYTGPNLWLPKFGYPLVRELRRFHFKHKPPPSPHGDRRHLTHIDGQSPLSLKRDLKKGGFKARILPCASFSEINSFLRKGPAAKLLCARPAGYFFCHSLLAVAEPREGGSEAQLRVGRVLRMINPREGEKVLLIGEAEGMLAAKLAKIPEVEVTWLEPGHADGGETPAASLPANGYARLLGDPWRLPFGDSEFDAVASQFMLEQAGEPPLALREWSRVLKNGGSLTLVASNRNYRGLEPRPKPRAPHAFYPTQLRRLAEGAGLRVVGTTTLIPDLKIPALYRGDYSFSLPFEKIPYFKNRGKLLLLQAIKE